MLFVPPHQLHLVYPARILLHLPQSLQGIMCPLAFLVAIIYLLHVLPCGVSEADSTQPVYFSLIVSGGENGFSSLGGIPSIDLALEAVEKEELLPGYNLTYDSIGNSKVSS